MAERPCNCGMLCLGLKSSLCSCRQLLYVRPPCTEHVCVVKSAFIEGVGHYERKFQNEVGVAHQPMSVSENWSDCPIVWYQNIRSASLSFVTIHASNRRTDRQTDEQNCDSNTVRCITCCRMEKGVTLCFDSLNCYTRFIYTNFLSYRKSLNKCPRCLFVQ